MLDTQTPLLGGDAVNGTPSGAESASLEAGTRQQGAITFAELLATDPDNVIDHLAERGTKLCGTFVTKDTEVLPLLRDGTCWTLGANSMDIDHEAAWRQNLKRDHRIPFKGFSSKVEVEAHVVTFRDAAQPGDAGLLVPLLKKWHDGALSTKVFGLPAVQAVITHKWNAFASRVLLFEFCCYLLCLFGYQIFIILFQDEDLSLSLGELARTPRGATEIAALSASLLGMTPFLYFEWCFLRKYGFFCWANLCNLTGTATCLLEVAVAAMWFARFRIDGQAASIMAAAVVLLLYWKVQFYARAFLPLKNSFMDSMRAVITDVRWLLMLLIVTLWGFSSAFYILFRHDQGTRFSNIWHTNLTLFKVMLDGFEPNMFYDTRHAVLGTTLVLVFVFLMSLVLLNCLIAMMAEAATKAADEDGTKYLRSKAQLIEELETSIPDWVRRPSWTPAFIHILKVNPASAQTVDCGRLWTLSTQEGEGAKLTAAADDVKGQLRELSQQVAELKGQNARLEELLREIAAKQT